MPAPYLSDPATDPDGFGQPDLVAQQDALLRRKALLVEQARQAAAQLGIYAPAQPDNTEVGGFTLSTGQRIPGRVISNWGTALKAAAPLVAQSRLQGDTQQLDSDQGVFNARARADAIARLSAMPQGTPATPDTYGSGPEGPTMTPGTPAKPASLRDTLTWAAGLGANPNTQGVGQKVIENQLVTLPQKQAEQVLEYLKLTEQHRHNTAEEGKPISVPQVGMFVKDDTAPNGYRMVAATPDKPLDVAAAKDYRENTVQISQIDDAIKLLRSPAGKNATGLWQGALNAIPGVGTPALDLFDSQGKATRALVSQIASAKIKNTSGQAVSATEFPRLRPWIPQVGDENDTVIMKLENFRNEYQKMQNEIANQATAQGQKQPTPTRPLEPNKNGPNPPVKVVMPTQDTPSAPALIQQWRDASPDRKGLVEQQMLSQGMVYKGHTYQGGDPSQQSSWSK